MEQPKIINGNGMILLFKLQNDLLKEYQVLEQLPEYPLDIHARVNQKLIKGYAGKLVEELSEGFAELSLALDNVSTNQVSVAQENIKNYNYEMADVLHFLMEILILTGVDNEYLLNHFEAKLLDRGMEGILVKDDMYKTLFKLGSFLNIMNQTSVKGSQFNIFTQQDNMDFPEFSGGSKISNDSLHMHAKFCWSITHAMYTTTNYLKNRDWLKEEIKVNDIKFYEGLLETVTMIFQYFNFAGMSDLGLFKIYVMKNTINKELIKNGYK